MAPRPIPVVLTAILALSPLLVSAQDTAALIIGGFWYQQDGPPITEHFEIFGCPGAREDSYSLNEFPEAHYLANGVKVVDEDRIIVCGGYACTDRCSTVKDCYSWSPHNNSWSVAPPLNQERFNFLMANVKHKDNPDQGEVPLVLGYFRNTEIFDPMEDKWMQYESLPSSWYGLDCLIAYNDKIYSMRDALNELDPETWNITELISAVEMPASLKRSGRCTGLTIDGHPGIFTRFGYWYDLVDEKWIRKASPPIEPTQGLTKEMWSFRGRPTIFGNPVCNDTAECENIGVIQYNPDLNQWETLGKMLYARIYHTIIEVPASFCDSLNIEKTTTTTTTTSTTTTSTTTKTTTYTTTSSTSVVTGETTTEDASTTTTASSASTLTLLSYLTLAFCGFKTSFLL